MKSQSERILAHLKAGKSIDPLMALDKFNCLRLSGRILDLRRDGHPIKTKIVKRRGKRFASYKLAA